MAEHPESIRMPHQESRRPSPEAPHSVRSDDLLRGKKVVFILHRGETYRLRCTRQGKLILCK